MLYSFEYVHAGIFATGQGVVHVLTGMMMSSLDIGLRVALPLLGVIFLETIIGAPLMRLALHRAGETFVDKLGKACILGAEGAPPVITLKLIDWEVRAGENSSRVGKVLWTVRDEETVSEVTEGALRRILLKVKPDAYVSMMQARRL